VKIEEKEIKLEDLEEENIHTPDDPTAQEETILSTPAPPPTPSSLIYIYIHRLGAYNDR